MEDKLYHYLAIVAGVHDGDTITVDIDLGCRTWIHGEKIRLYGINSPELRGATKAAGIAARDYLASMVNGKKVLLRTYLDKREKYGRLLAEVWLGAINVNDAMLQAGHAVVYEVDK